MRAYEIYYQEHADKYHLIGILPERRKDAQRITPESIMNWARILFGNDWDMEKISFIEVAINKATGEWVESKPKD